VSRVLLTGSTGFIGRHVLDVLVEKGYEVHAVARRAETPRTGVTWHEVDLLREDAAGDLVRAAGVDELVHLAWYATPGSFWSAPENERWIDASLRLLRAFGETGGRRAVLAGTCAEYAWGGDSLRENDTSLEPATLYGACKHATQVAAAGVARELGVSLAWGRVFFLYGPGERPGRLVSSVARDLLAGKEVGTSDGRQRRDFMYVGDVARAFVAILESAVSGPVNVASGRPVAVRDLVALIGRASGGLDRVCFGALPLREDEPPVIAGDVRRLTEEVGFHPDTGLEQGIEQTVAWWRQRMAGARSGCGSAAREWVR
jgi:nucleoside-diphosphate-sugar epimerase